ncbi:hypothetical protein DY000_02047271 [Brassica cretica]|uniref:Serpin domain-containing protein n=1 Tax=Brassica cretica TaxID=69181 RepID=A0ABQ7F9H4_BRACR|nr:hypothetical protein DY000_02047271 [Brassica cretica]
MYFYLPDKNDGLDDLMKAMATTSGFVDCHVPISKVLVNKFRIPKFKIAYGLDGQDLGLRSMALYHKACVEIDEEGAKAAAATFVVSCGCARYMEPPKRIDFVADHPFLFLIREDKTGFCLLVRSKILPTNLLRACATVVNVDYNTLKTSGGQTRYTKTESNDKKLDSTDEFDDKVPTDCSPHDFSN